MNVAVYQSNMANSTPIIAGFLSFLYPGLGHVYLRRWKRAGFWALFWFLFISISIPAGAFQNTNTAQELLAATGTLSPITLIGLVIIPGVCIADSYLISTKSEANDG